MNLMSVMSATHRLTTHDITVSAYTAGTLSIDDIDIDNFEQYNDIDYKISIVSFIDTVYPGIDIRPFQL